MFTKLSSIIQLIRVKQWFKNLFLFVPLFFAGELMDWSKYPSLIIGFFAFCFTSSSVYVLNDLNDIENDRNHPEKKKRPLASGAIKVGEARVLMLSLLIVVTLLLLLLSKKFALIIIAYLLLNIFYTSVGKKISILDVFLISVGFLLRIKAGGVVTDIALSKWIVIMVFLLALFLAFAKRRDDLVIKADTGLDIRAASKNYSLEFLNTVLALLCGVIIVSYLMYCFSPEVIDRIGTYRIYYTVIFVILGLLRYLQITIVNLDSGSPSKILLKDRFIQIVIFGWVVSFYVLMYFNDYLTLLTSGLRHTP